MNTLNKEETYTNFLECINKASDIESLYDTALGLIHKIFNSNRVQIWEKVKDSNEISVLHEFTAGNKNSMLKFRTPILPESAKRTFERISIWEYQNITDKSLTEFKIRSLIGVHFQLPSEDKGCLILTFENENNNLNDTELAFLIRLKIQLEIGVLKIYKLQKITDEASRLLKQNTRLREQDRLKANFTNNISHEFRTPLASIVGFSKMLLTKSHPIESVKEIAQQIQQAANRLSSLISDFLQINRTSTEGRTANFEPCDIGEIIKYSVEEFYSLNKTHKVSYVISDNYPILNSDPKLVRQVLDNLISNAIKYSPKGGNVIVSLDFSESDKELKVSVTDQGIGIDKEEISKIFNRLYRSTNPEVQKITGSGLGLAICKEIITVLNGKIYVESKLEKGSKFSFTLPIN